MKKYAVIIILLSLFINNDIFPQMKTIRVFFWDKGPDEFKKGSELYQTTINTLSERAISRRIKTLGGDNFVSYEDAPVYPEYIKKITSTGAQHLLTLKWRNYAVFRCDSQLLEEITGLSFIKSVQFTSSKIALQNTEMQTKSFANFYKENMDLQYFSNNEELEYGNSYNQVHLINAEKLHELGITGDSVIIAIMDSGFRWKKHESLKNAKVLIEQDFIQNDSISENEKDDINAQDGHGTLVFSSIAGYYPKELIGIAPSSDFILCKTESMPLEIHLEEDNFAAALELAEATGADITTSSLAYHYFDETDESYTNDEFDGHTSISALAINKAVSKGMVCFTAAGNTGPNPKSLLTPGDADSAITVGAAKIVNNSVLQAKFSSRGPCSDSAIKPDISALGVKVACANPGEIDKFLTANGTSLATPMAAGAGALLLSCFPELKTWEVREILFKSCSQYPNKDNVKGYGVINILEAMKKTGIIISPPVIFPNVDYMRVIFHIVPQGQLIKNPELTLIVNSESFNYILYPDYHEYRYICDIPSSVLKENTGLFYLEVSTYDDYRRYPYNNKDFIKLNNSTRQFPFGFTINNFIPYNRTNNLSVFPTIVDRNVEHINLDLTSPNGGNINVKVTSINGETLFQKTIESREPGILSFQIPVQNLNNGMYFVEIFSKNRINTAKFIKLD